MSAHRPSAGTPVIIPVVFHRERGLGWKAAALLTAATIAVYGGTFHVPLLFDDLPSIVDNPTIRHLWPLSGPLSPPVVAGITVDGRPLLNVSLAVNYAISGIRVWSYHALNLFIHVLAGLALFGIMRRTLSRCECAAALGAETAAQEWLGPDLLAVAVAFCWTLHPLQTESVTYIIQRAESLMGMCYLLALYCFVRAADSSDPEPRPIAGSPDRPRRGSIWYVLSVATCLLGMASKEVMVSAPVIVVLYDRTFCAGSFGGALRRRPRYYLALFGTWILLGWLVLRTGNRGGSSGIGSGADAEAYWLTQFPAVVRYLRLAVWPHPLVFDYGTEWVQSVAAIWPSILAVIVLVLGTIWALCSRNRRARALGFLGFWFFAILAPTSLVPGNRQTAAEHRMYLALAPVVVLVLIGVHRGLGRCARLAGAANRVAFAIVVLASVAGLGALTVLRNRDYMTEESMWQDTVAKNPSNAWAHVDLGEAFYHSPGRLHDAIAEFQLALHLMPNLAEAHNDLGNAWSNVPGRSGDAVAEFEAAVRLQPQFAIAHNNLGNALSNVPGRLNDAIAQYQVALRLRSDYPEAHYNLGNAWSNVPGRLDDAIAEYQAALRLEPNVGAVHTNLGYALNAAGRTLEATAEFAAAVRLQPDSAEAHSNLGNAWANTPGRLPDAIAQYKEALRLKPEDWEVHLNVAVALLSAPGRGEEARAHLEAVLRLQPGNDQARQLLATHPAARP